LYIFHFDIKDEKKLISLGQKIGKIKLLNENAQCILIGNKNSSMAEKIDQVIF
jgi:hypothetical protein